MKKLMLSLCALCLVGVAGAQVLKYPLREKAQRFEQQSEVSPFDHKLGVQVAESSPARKAEASIDSIFVQSAYFWDGGDQQYRYMGTKSYKQTGYCNEDKIMWVYGTGGFLTWSGPGEIGYRFFVGDESLYELNNMYPRYGVP